MLTARFYPCQGGAEIQCLRLSVKLSRLGHKVLILTQKMPNTNTFDLVEGLPVFRIGLPLANRLGSLFYFAAALKTILKRFSEIDLLHAHIASTPALIAAVLTKFTGKPSIVKFAGSRASGDISTSLKTAHGALKLNFIKRNATALVCPSAEIAAELSEYGFDINKINIIPNGVDTSVYAPASNAEKIRLKYVLGLPKDCKLVIYSGRLVKGKGLELLLDCWNRMNSDKEHAAACLLISGSGPLEAGLKRTCLGMPSVVFLGWKENVVEYLKASDIFVLPSTGEGMPNSLMEAMSCGLACVGTDIGGIRELVTDKQNGLLFSSGDPVSLTRALQTYLIDQDFANECGAKARQCITNKYSIEFAAKAYIELYNKMLNRSDKR
jgi:glycosyltransferase involved in cell wall biosynthesis